MFYLTPLGVVIVTWGGWFRIALFLLVYAVLIMYGFALMLRRLDNTRKARERRSREMPAEARARIGELAAALVEEQKACKALRSENGRMLSFLAEESNHGRNWRSDVQAFLKEVSRG